VTARVDDEQIADRIEPDGTITRYADVAAELLPSIGHPDGAAHRPHLTTVSRVAIVREP